MGRAFEPCFVEGLEFLAEIYFVDRVVSLIVEIRLPAEN